MVSFFPMHSNSDHSTKDDNDSFIIARQVESTYAFWKTKSEFSLIRPGSTEPEKLVMNVPGKLVIVGSSNGLVCLTYSDNRRFGVEFMVMNPALKEHRNLCKLASDQFDKSVNRMACTVVGFGFDEKNRDFKILRFERVVGKAGHSTDQAYLYSLRSDFWKKMEIPQDKTFNRGSHVCMLTLGSCLYCLSYAPDNKTSVILGFDLCTETFHTIPLPESRNLDCEQILTWKNESLAVVLCNRENGFYELWTVDNSPEKFPINDDSWKMKTTFTLDGLPDKMFATPWNDIFAFMYWHDKSYSLMYLKKKKNKFGKPELARNIHIHSSWICYYKETQIPLPPLPEPLKTKAITEYDGALYAVRL